MGTLGALGGILGGFLDEGEADKAKNYQDQVLNIANALPNDSAMAGVRADPAMIAAQRQALNGLMARGVDGYTVEDKAANQQMLDDVAQREAGARGALMQSAQARGLGGSGLDFATQLANQQGSATRANQAGTMLAAEGRRRALQSLQAGGALAGLMRGQGFDEASRKAAAQDEINFRNAQMRMGAYGNASNYYQGRYNDARAEGAAIGQTADDGAKALAGAMTGNPAAMAGAMGGSDDKKKNPYGGGGSYGYGGM